MARHLAALRPRARVIAFTPHERTRNSLSAIWGLEPHLLNFNCLSYELLAQADEELLRCGAAKKGQTIIAMAGRLPEQPSLSSMMKLHKVGEIEAPKRGE